MMRRRNPATIALQADQQAHAALLEAKWTFGPTDDLTIYKLRLDLATPAIITEEKGNAPAIGLPTLDGFLSYVAFRSALGDAIETNPSLAQSLIWQWNVALRDQSMWIDFPLPLREIQLSGMPSVFDCSIGLPSDKTGNLIIPAGSLFANDITFTAYPDVIDSIPLRRRVAEPFGRPIALNKKLETAEGSNKALDNRLYFPLTTRYTFLFRGDRNGVERLLKYAQQEYIGLGKKTALGHGQIAQFEIDIAQNTGATFTYPILSKTQISLIKNLPYDYILRARDTQDIAQQTENEQLFGCNQFRLSAAIESFGTYRAPYWQRNQRTQIIRYGSIIQSR